MNVAFSQTKKITAIRHKYCDDASSKLFYWHYLIYNFGTRTRRYTGRHNLIEFIF